MREVLIKTYTKHKDFYEVALGNGTEYRFPSEKAAKKFLADTNRFLTEIAFQANQILAEAYTHSREIWIISNELNQREVNERIEMLSHFLKQAYDRAGWRSGNFFTFIDLRKFCDYAKMLLKTFRNVKYVSQTDTLRKHKLDHLFTQVQGLQLRLLNYGQSEAFQTFETNKIEHIADCVDMNFILKVA